MKTNCVKAGLWFLIGINISAFALQATLYVSPSGSDLNPGTIAQPFLTLERARQSVDSINNSMTDDIVVYLRGGIYQLSATQIFDETDGGSNGHWVIYQNFTGETPAFSGGIPMNSGWALVSGKADIYEKTVPEIASGVWWPRSMYADGNRLIDLNVNADRIDVRSWSFSRFDPVYTGSVNTISAGGNLLNSYAIDRTSGKIFLRSSTNPNTRDIRAPKLQSLFDISGTTGNRITNLRFVGITFQHTLWPFPAEGYSEGWAGNYNGSFDNGYKLVPNMITVEYGRSIEFIKCKIGHTEHNGLGFGRGAGKCKIIGCEFFDNGAKGLYIGYRGRCTTSGIVKHDWSCGKGGSYCSSGGPLNVTCLWEGVASDVPDSFEVTDNTVHDVGVIYRGCPGIHIEMIRGKCLVAYNEVYNTQYSGIIFQNFQMPKTAAEIRYNEVHHTCLDSRMEDGQPIYESNNDYGMIETNNVLWSNGNTDNSGIYLDEFGCQVTVQNNVFQLTSEEWINNTSGHTIANNIRGASQKQIDSARALAGPRSLPTTIRPKPAIRTGSFSGAVAQYYDTRGRVVRQGVFGKGVMIQCSPGIAARGRVMVKSPNVSHE